MTFRGQRQTTLQHALLRFQHAEEEVQPIAVVPRIALCCDLGCPQRDVIVDLAILDDAFQRDKERVLVSGLQKQKSRQRPCESPVSILEWMDRQQPQDEVRDQHQAMPLRLFPAALQLGDEALHPPPCSCRIGGPDGHRQSLAGANLDAAGGLLVVAAVPGILLRVLEQDAVKFFQRAFGHTKGLVLFADQLKEIAISADLLFIPRAEYVDLDAGQHITDLVISQLGALDSRRGGNGLNHRHHS